MSGPIDDREPASLGSVPGCPPSLRFAESRSRKREILAELRDSWQQGRPTRPEHLLEHWPGEPRTDPDVASLLFEDYLQRAEHGERPTTQDYEERFPEHRDSLARLFDQQDLLRSLGASNPSMPELRLPAVGEELFGFRLKRELGCGAFARVFLAEQGNLAGRPVVLKVSAIEGDEPQTLAQLQHTHIVPIHSVHEDPRAGLRAVCMPYFGGASLSQVLYRLWQTTSHPTTGDELVRALSIASGSSAVSGGRGSGGRGSCRAGSAGASPSPANGSAGASPSPANGSGRASSSLEQGPLTLLRQMSYVRAAVWLVARIAEGLQHAHERGVLHRDIKPSNILLGDDGQPMLLDFNLAQQAHADPASATLGGTVAYMAPEHLRALARHEAVLDREVDARADIYSLGMVLYEILTGARPFDQSASYTPLPMLIEAMAVERSAKVPSLRQARPDVPWGLESVVRKCLDPDPKKRYQKAEHLAEDLRRLLDDRPLRHAPELSRAERVQKWARRHPRLTSMSAVASAAAVLLALGGVALAATRGRLDQAEDRLEETQARDRFRDHDAGTLRSLLLLNTTSDQPQEHLREGLRACEQTLALFGVLEGRRIEDHPDWARRTEAERRRLAEQTQELLLLLAGARVRLAPGDRDVLRQALSLLESAERLPGLPPSRALYEDRAAYLDALGERPGARVARKVAGAIEPSSTRDFYLMATADARRGRYAEALADLDEALRREPRHYWSWAQRGICHEERKEYDLAAADFSVCVGLWPDFAWSHFNRACALDHGRHREEAIRGYGDALRLDPSFVLAWLNRGLARIELGRDREALADFDQAVARGLDNAFVHSGRGIALERLGRLAEADRAFLESARRAERLPPAQRVRLQVAYGFAVALRLPEPARAAFEEVLRLSPNHAEALYGCALVLDRERKAERALAFYDRAVQVAPGFVEPRRFRALLHARRGNTAEAVNDINACLERDSGGATLYAAACVTALLAERVGRTPEGKSLTEQSLAFLGKAFAQGYGQDRAAADEDLVGLHSNAEFCRLLKKRTR